MSYHSKEVERTQNTQTNSSYKNLVRKSKRIKSINTSPIIKNIKKSVREGVNKTIYSFINSNIKALEEKTVVNCPEVGYCALP